MKEIWIGNKPHIYAAAGHSIYVFTKDKLSVDVIRHKGSIKSNTGTQQISYYTFRLSFNNKEFLEVKTQDVIQLYNDKSILEYLMNNKEFNLLNEIYLVGLKDGELKAKRKIRAYLHVEEDE